MHFKYYINNPRKIGVFLVRRLGQWLPDELYLRLLYLFEIGKRLNLKRPRTFQEKIQWLKLNDRRPEYTNMVDKYAVKDYVSKMIGPEYVIPTLGVWNSFDEINFKKLPNKFVLKTTHGGGSCGVVICSDKSIFDIHKARRILETSLNSDIYTIMREWPYKNVPRKIIAEQLLEASNGMEIADYKIFCFNGEPKYIQVIKDRTTHETIDFFDTEWNHQVFTGLNPYSNSLEPIPRPNNLEQMINIAKLLAKNKPFVRIDMYIVNNKVYFGEITFYPASGFGFFMPSEWDYLIGDLLILPNMNK